MAELLGHFVGSPESRDLAEWGLQEVETARGVGLIRREGRFRPTVDIAGVGLGLADVIDGDRYRTTSVELDRHLPSIWFHESGRDEVERIQRTAALVLTHGALFLLLVTRSYIDGAPPYETTETLERFREPFSQRLRSGGPV